MVFGGLVSRNSCQVGIRPLRSDLSTLTMWFVLVLLVGLLLGAVDVSSQEPGNNKTVTHKEQKSEQDKSTANIKSAPTNQLKPATIQDAGEKTDAHAKSETDTDGQLVEYTRQLAVYTKQLSSYTFWLVIATAILGGIGAYQGWQIRRSVDSSEKAANAAYQAQRAFVAFITVEPIAFTDPKTRTVTHYTFSPQWKNTGSTP